MSIKIMHFGKLQTTLLTFAFCATFCSQVTNAQVKKAKGKLKVAKKQKFVQKLRLTGKNSSVVSFGVINAHVSKSEDLVKPLYPSAAKTLGVSGTVQVEVLIDEQGNIVEAEAISGHPLLRGVSVLAARQSKFKPIIISDISVRARGIIVYNFVPVSFNWLEIGYTLQNQNNHSIYNYENLTELLPSEFESERQMLQIVIKDWESKDLILPNVHSMIENQLSDKLKELWLFSLGEFLPEVDTNIGCDVEMRQDSLQKLRLLLQTAPESVKPALIIKLQKLIHFLENSSLDAYDPATGSKSRETFNELLENISILGK